MITAVIIEDSRLARLELSQQLSKFPQIDVVGEAGSYDSAIKLINEQDPELIFMDIHLPGKSGFDILQQLDFVPAVIFTTAFDEYALQSFEFNAIDYLLKPISEDRLAKAVQKAEATLAKHSPVSNQLVSGNQRIFIKEGEKCWFVTLADISLFESRGNYTQVYFNSEYPLLLKTLQQLEQTLDPRLFIRVNRQQIVNVNFIESVSEWFGGKLKLIMKSKQTIEVSRRQASKIKDMFSV